MNMENPQQPKAESVSGHVNGQASKPIRDRLTVQREIYGDRSAVYFEHGRVCTFIFAEQRLWGEIEFRVQQVRKGLNGQFSDGFRSEDVQDMIRGANQAKQWINKRQRSLAWKVLVAW